jgi:hypothetical protein
MDAFLTLRDWRMSAPFYILFTTDKPCENEALPSWALCCFRGGCADRPTLTIRFGCPEISVAPQARNARRETRGNWLVGPVNDERPHAFDSAITHELWSYQIAVYEGVCDYQ